MKVGLCSRIIFLEISQTFRRNIRTVRQKIQTKIIMVNRKFAIHRESSKKRTFKTAKSRRINTPRRGKIINYFLTAPALTPESFPVLNAFFIILSRKYPNYIKGSASVRILPADQGAEKNCFLRPAADPE